MKDSSTIIDYPQRLKKEVLIFEIHLGRSEIFN